MCWGMWRLLIGIYFCYTVVLFAGGDYNIKRVTYTKASKLVDMSLVVNWSQVKGCKSKRHILSFLLFLVVHLSTAQDFWDWNLYFWTHIKMKADLQVSSFYKVCEFSASNNSNIIIYALFFILNICQFNGCKCFPNCR